MGDGKLKYRFLSDSMVSHHKEEGAVLLCGQVCVGHHYCHSINPHLAEISTMHRFMPKVLYFRNETVAFIPIKSGIVSGYN